MRHNTRHGLVSFLTVVLPGFSIGTLLGWEYVLTLNNDSNPTSLPLAYLCAILGCITSSLVMDKWGRRWAMITHMPFAYITLIVRIISSSDSTLMVIRCLGGIAIGAYYQTIPVYIAEIAYRKCRGRLLAVVGTVIAIGICFSSNAYVKRAMLAIDLILGLSFLVLMFFFVPETPYFHFNKHEMSKGKKILQKLRTSSEAWSGELREMNLDIAAYPRDASNCFAFAVSLTEMHADFAHRTVTTFGLTLIAECIFISCHNGVNKLYFTYLVEDTLIFLGQIIIVIAACIVNLFIIDNYGRKLLLLFSTVGVACFYLLLFIFLIIPAFAHKSLIISIVHKLVVFYYYVGMDFIPFIYLAELWPYNIRAPGVCFVLCFRFLAKALNPIINFYGIGCLTYSVVVLWYVLIAAAGIAFVWFIPPETKQLSICAIQIKMDHDVTILEKKLELD